MFLFCKQMEPSSFPAGLNVNYPSPRVVSEAHLSILKCPIGMVPILRNGRRDKIEVYFTDQVVNNGEQQEVRFLFLFYFQNDLVIRFFN